MLFSHARPPSWGFGGHYGLSALPICTQSNQNESKQLLVQLIMPASILSKIGTNRIKGQWMAGFRVQKGHIFGHSPVDHLWNYTTAHTTKGKHLHNAKLISANIFVACRLSLFLGTPFARSTSMPTIHLPGHHEAHHPP